MNLTRRNLILGGVFTISTLSMMACSKEQKYYKTWVPTGNEKKFEEGTHVITQRVTFDMYTSPDSQIDIPEGYKLFSTQDIIESVRLKFGSDVHTAGTIYTFINTSPVIAKEYTYYNQRYEAEKTMYPFAGKIVQKKLVKEVK